MSGASPMSGEGKQAIAALQLSPRLQDLDIDWKLIPDNLKMVSACTA